MVRWLPLLGLIACDVPSRGFAVTLSYPDDGGEAGPDVIVKVAFSQEPGDACADAIRLVAVAGPNDPRVMWEIDTGFEPDTSASAKPNTYLLTPAERLAVGVRYAIVVPNGAGGCTSARGDDVEPFVSYFTVQEGAQDG